MNSAILYFIRFIIKFLPETKAFRFKRTLYRFAGITIGENVRICSSAMFLGVGKLTIGANSWIGHQTLIISTDLVQIGENVDIAPRVFIGTGTHEIDIKDTHIASKGISQPIIIGDGCWICAGAVLLPGTILGEKCIVAAGAVVKGKIQSFSLVGGVPAKLIKILK